MASFKVRRKLLAQGGLQVGSSGSNVSTMFYGTVSACVPAMNASGLGAGSMSIPEAAGSTTLLFFSGSDTGGILVYAASVDSAGVVTASYMADDATIASTLRFHYFGITP